MSRSNRAASSRASEQTEGAQRIAHALKRKTLLGGERQKLLQAHYAGAIPADLLATEMRRFTRELAEAEVEIQAAGINTVELAAVLEAALRAVTNCETAHLAAPNPIRRQINQGFFKKLYTNEDGNVARVELTEPFATLLRAAPPRWRNRTHHPRLTPWWPSSRRDTSSWRPRSPSGRWRWSPLAGHGRRT